MSLLAIIRIMHAEKLSFTWKVLNQRFRSSAFHLLKLYTCLVSESRCVNDPLMQIGCAGSEDIRE